jgi:hypothetical protein
MTKMPNEPIREAESAGSRPSDPAEPVAKLSPGFRAPQTLAQLIESRLYTYCLSGGPVMGSALIAAIRVTVQKALADYFCLDIQGHALALSTWVHRRGQLTAIVVYAPGAPWLVVRSGGRALAEIRLPLLGYRAGDAEEAINPRSAAKAKGRAWQCLRRNNWETASEVLALNEILRSELLRDKWQDHLTAKVVGMRQGPPYPIRLQRWQLLEIAALFLDIPDAQARLTLQKVLEWCDPVLRGQVAENPNVKACEYNFALDAAAPALRATRLRWTRTFPAFWALHGVSPVRELIDAAQPVIKPIASLFGCSNGVVRRLRTVEDADIWLRAPGAFDYDFVRAAAPGYEENRDPGYDLGCLLLDGLADLTAGQIPPAEALLPLADELPAGPRSDDPVRSVICASFHVAVRLTPGRQARFRMAIPSFRPMMAAIGGAWDVVAHQIETITVGQVRGIADFVREMGRNLVLPALLRGGDDSDPVLRLFEKARTQMGLLLASRWHVGQFLQRSTRWHKAQGIAIVEGGCAGRQELVWLPWFQPVRVGDVRVVPLCSSAALREEGVVMHHCVGGYDVACATQPTQIFSVQTADRIRLSTLQLKVRPGKNKGEFRFTIEEHLAALNARPEQQALRAAATLLTALNGGQIPHQVARALNYRSEIAAHDLCPFDFDDDAAWETARACYMPLLPADLRALSPLEFGRLAAEFKLSESLSPFGREEEQDSESDDFETRVLQWMK